ncbi:DgyrCDS14157 [Dimorphilus gyrociliatus]|uniref:DgyrCDS14157 n=1 Tax=Dimorphilus gyrociliatus TaxID=2664684 RepID=A0A7I8WCS7_9ANNE|nr:DgyrCDS14157 [Dimorphilus gyrociliatus]
MNIQGSIVVIQNNQSFTIFCRASGYPTPSVRLLKNGNPEPSSKILKGGGKFKITPKEPFAVYQCEASQAQQGSAVSNSYYVHTYVARNQFQSKQVDIPFRTAKVLDCSTRGKFGDFPPTLIPEWRKTGSRTAMEKNDSIHVFEDKLYILEAFENLSVGCLLPTPPCCFGGIFETSWDTYVDQDEMNDKIIPKLERLYPKESVNKLKAVEGEPFTLTCIFGGDTSALELRWSTPGDVKYSRLVKRGKFNRTLKISRFGSDFIGTYTCSARMNRHYSEVKYRVAMVSKPTWIDSGPKSQTVYDEDEHVKFECKANGTPKPKVTWLINGKPVDKRRVILKDDDTQMILKKVTKPNRTMIQCNASNEYGHVFKNVHLRVLRLTPTAVESEKNHSEILVGQNSLFSCAAYGFPKPVVRWYKYKLDEPIDPYSLDVDKEIFNSLHYETNVYGTEIGNVPAFNSTLLIKDAKKDHYAAYLCEFSNKHGSNVNVRKLTVFSRTHIVNDKVDLKFMENETMKQIVCQISIDRALEDKIRIKWSRLEDGRSSFEPMEYDNNIFLSKTKFDRDTLVFSEVNINHTAKYRCEVFSAMDQATASWELGVIGRPSPIRGLKMSGCSSGRRINLMLEAGRSNGADLIGYKVTEIISLEDDPWEILDERETFHKGNYGELKTISKLYPGVHIKIKVVAVNIYGESKPYEIVGCTVKYTAPSANPTNLCSINGEPGTLVLKWKGIDYRAVGGKNFEYILRIKKSHSVVASAVEYGKESYTFKPAEIFQTYLVEVVSKNEFGLSDENSQVMEVFSSEGKPPPTSRITNVKVINPDDIDQFGVRIKTLGTSAEEIHSEFKGFLIEYVVRVIYNDDSGQIEDFVYKMEEPIFCRPSDFTFRRTRDVSSQKYPSFIEIPLNDLKPFTRSSIIVFAKNSRGQVNPESEPLKLITPMSAPSQIPYDSILCKTAPFYVQCSFGRPLKLNGIASSTEVCLRKKRDTNCLCSLSIEPDVNEFVCSNRIEEETDYELTLIPTTRPQNPIEGPKTDYNLRTSSSNIPLRKPIVEVEEVNSSTAKVVWIFQKEDKGVQPLHFKAEFNIYDSKVNVTRWNETNIVFRKNTIYINNLEEGIDYIVRVKGYIGRLNGESFTPLNSIESETVIFLLGVRILKPTTVGMTSGQKDFQTTPVLDSFSLDPNDDAVTGARGTALIIGIICAILALVIVVAVVGLRYYNKEHKYHVEEKEKENGICPPKNASDTESFLTRTSPPSFYQRGDSLGPAPTHISDSDSEYEEADSSKYFEDGSFIGLYIGKEEKPENGIIQHTRNGKPGALTTFV